MSELWYFHEIWKTYLEWYTSALGMVDCSIFPTCAAWGYAKWTVETVYRDGTPLLIEAEWRIYASVK